MTDPTSVRQGHPSQRGLMATLDVRLLFLFFVLVYVGDHYLTTWGLDHGVVEGNPLARSWYEHGDTVALGMKAAGMGLVSLLTVLVPRTVKGGDIIVRWALVFWATIFLVIDLHNLVRAVLG